MLQKARLESIMLNKLEVLHKSFETLNPDDYKALGFGKNNHHYCIRGLLGYAILNYDDMTIIDNILYAPYATKMLKYYLDGVEDYKGSTKLNNLQDKMTQIRYNWSHFIWAANDKELPPDLYARWYEERRKHAFRITIYAVDLSYTFGEIMARTCEKVASDKTHGVTVPARTKRHCITANNGTNVTDKIYAQQNNIIPNWKLDIIACIEFMAEKMIKEHGVVVVKDLIPDYILDNVITQNVVLKLKRGQVKSTIEGFIPGVMERLNLELARSSVTWQLRYPYLEQFEYNTRFYHQMTQ
jgi:hypothetical protein